MSQNKINPKHRNQIRIIGGQWRGRKIQFPNLNGLRPTPDSVRERLFNWLGQDLTGQTVLDLFAGSGALGFEAASRHAKHVIMCDIQPQAIRSLRQHAQQLASPNITIYQCDGIEWIQQQNQTFDLIFLDPPFAWQDWATLLPTLHTTLAPTGSLYLEASQLPSLPHWLTPIKQSKAGQSQQYLLQRTE